MPSFALAVTTTVATLPPIAFQLGLSECGWSRNENQQPLRAYLRSHPASSIEPPIQTVLPSVHRAGHDHSNPTSAPASAIATAILIKTIMSRSVSRRVAGSAEESLETQRSFAQQAQRDSRG